MRWYWYLNDEYNVYNVNKMTEIPISARISPMLDKELEGFMKQERLEKSVAIRKILYLGLKEWKQERALRLLEKGKITLVKAAALSGMGIWEFADLLKKSGITWIKTSPEEMRKDIMAALER